MLHHAVEGEPYEKCFLILSQLLHPTFIYTMLAISRVHGCIHTFVYTHVTTTHA